MGNSKEGRLSVLETRMAMWQMKVAGRSVSEIAKEFGVSVRTVHYDLKDAVSLIDATKWLEVETQTDLSRLERLLEAWWPTAVGAKGLEKTSEAAMLVLKILDQKAKLLGLNAPKRVDINAFIYEWAEARGLNPQDVIDVTPGLIPIAKAPNP